MSNGPEKVEQQLRDLYDAVAEGCVECGLCQKDCRFLQKYGSPKQIAEKRSFNPGTLQTSFECSLCQLCTAVCPKEIDPAAMFMAMRNQAQAAGHGSLGRHDTILRYERWGASPIISWYGLPEGCDTVFFPGCAMAGSRADQVYALYMRFRQSIPSLGIVLDCCTKPSHDLGRRDYFGRMFGSLRTALAEKGVKKILVACPSCYRVWKDYGSPIVVKSIYEQLAEEGAVKRITSSVELTVHDPCPTRYDAAVQDSVRKLVMQMGFSLREMKHHGSKTLCCGEGGAACYIVPEFAGNWTTTRVKEAGDTPMVTYCAGCTNFLSRVAQVSHIVDLLLDPDKTMAGKEHVARSPLTWLKRVLLKQRLRKGFGPGITGGRSRDGQVVFRTDAERT